MSDSCREWRERIAGQVRGLSLPADRELNGHLQFCPSCADFCQEQQRLTEEFRILASSLAGNPTRLEMRARILEEFDRRQTPARRRPATLYTWAAAAVLLICALVGAGTWMRHRASVKQVVASASPQRTGRILSRVLAQNGGFVPVPFMPPLASGELVTVVRTKLPPAALLRMGLTTQNTDGSEVNAEVMMGEDGFPRAVRVY